MKRIGLGFSSVCSYDCDSLDAGHNFSLLFTYKIYRRRVIFNPTFLSKVLGRSICTVVDDGTTSSIDVGGHSLRLGITTSMSTYFTCWSTLRKWNWTIYVIR